MNREIRLRLFCGENECISLVENGKAIIPKVIEYKEEYKNYPKVIIADINDDKILYLPPEKANEKDHDNLMDAYDLLDNNWDTCMKRFVPIPVDLVLELISVYIGGKERWKTYYNKKEDFIKDLMVNTLDFLIEVAKRTHGDKWKKIFEMQQYELEKEGNIGLPVVLQVSIKPFLYDNMDYILSMYNDYFSMDKKPIKVEQTVKVKDSN